MKFDMHCHTKEGSIDAKVSIEAYIRQLVSKGFDGMLVTDHNSFNGYRSFEKISKRLSQELGRPFTVLKGIEYDTRDGGHMLVILPDHIHCKLIETRGLSLERLEKLVHELGGIIGPAHPYGTGFFAIMNTRCGKKQTRVKDAESIFSKFDFIETFNACNHRYANHKASALAAKYRKPQLAGSDAHSSGEVGTAYTHFKENITCNNDLIHAIREHTGTQTYGELLEKYQKKNLLLKHLGIIGYWLYNKTGALVYAPFRHHRSLRLPFRLS